MTLRARKRAKPQHKNKTYKVVTPIDAITLREIITTIKDLVDGLEIRDRVDEDLEDKANKLNLRLQKILSRIEY